MNRLTDLKTKTAIEHFGSVQKLADFLKVSRHAVYQWGEYVPEARAFQLQIKTNGKLIASSSDLDSNTEETELEAA